MAPIIIFLKQVLFLVLICSQGLLAQSILTGKVVDASGEALIGANVRSKQMPQGTATDQDGNYSILTGPSDTLLVSYVGFRNVEIAINDQTEINVILYSAPELLENVVVVGYDVQKRKDLTGAISSASEESFNGGIINAPEQLIRGKVAGVELIQNDGEPGAAFTVRIRGTSTIRAGNEPLYVIDGYPIDINDPGPLLNGPGRVTRKSPLEFLNPEDIASIDILKDASAAAIYGARGANGVVLITTKKGQSGRPSLAYSTYLGASRLRKKINVLSPEAYRNALTDFNLTTQDFGASTDWQDEVYRTAWINNHNLSVNGGIQDLRFRASIGFQDQQGLVRTTKYTKYNGRIQMQQSAINNRLQLEFNLSAALLRDHRAPRNTMIGTLNQNPTWPVLDENGKFFQSIPNPDFNHVRAKLELSSNVIKTTRLLTNLTASFELTEGLEYKMNLGGDLSNATGKSYEFPQISVSNGRAGISTRELSSNLIEHYLTYKKQVGKIQFTGLSGYSFQEFRNEGSLLERGNFSSDNIPLVNNISSGQETLDNLSWKEKNALQSFFGRVHLDFQDKYLLTANFRADGSTRFGANNKYGYFPSVAVAWRLSEEVFLRGVHNLDDLKIRASWGLTGNQEIPNKITQPVLGTPNNGQAILGAYGQPTIGYAFIRTANPNLQWEETRQTNLGIDLSLNQGRWNLSVDYFDKRTTDFLLFTRAVSAPTPSVWVNLDGEIINRGWEGALNAHLIKDRALKWETGFTFTTVTNTVEGLPSSIPVGSVIGPGQSGVVPQLIENGSPLGVFYGRRWLGFDDNGNDIFKKDEEGNELLEELGNGLPDFTWGWSNNLGFQNFELSFLLNGAHGHQILNNTFLAGIPKQSFQFGGNTTSEILYSEENFNNSLSYSSRHIEDGSFVRLSQVTIGYRFPVEKIFWLSQLTVYLTGSNLLLWTDYKGYDPEVNIPIDNFTAIPSIGIDYDAYPRPVSLQLGLKVRFL